MFSPHLICVIVHDNLTCVDYHEITILWGNRANILCNKQNNTWILRNMKFISTVEQDIHSK